MGKETGQNEGIEAHILIAALHSAEEKTQPITSQYIFHIVSFYLYTFFMYKSVF